MLKSLLFFIPLVSFAALEPAKLAIIDMQRAIQSVAEGKKARESLQKEWEDKQKKLQAEDKKIQEQFEKLNKQRAVLNPKDIREKEEAIQADMLKLREQAVRAQGEFQARDREVSGPIIKKIRETVAAISKEKGYTLVVDGNEGNVIFNNGTDDITEVVIKQYDAKK